MEDIINNDLLEARDELERFLSAASTVADIAAAANLCVEALQSGNKIISCGNGGSLCDATHFAEELTGRYRDNRRPLPAISINDPAYLTCTANDFSYDEVYSRYVEGVAKKGDVLLCISTSGTSRNILKAAEAARSKGVKVLSLTSARTPNPLCQLSDVSVCAPAAPHSDRIQEIHIKVIHILIHAIESAL